MYFVSGAGGILAIEIGVFGKEGTASVSGQRGVNGLGLTWTDWKQRAGITLPEGSSGKKCGKRGSNGPGKAPKVERLSRSD